MKYNRHLQCPEALSKKEKLICSRLKTRGKLFVFLREYRHEILNETIESQLIEMYADHPKGKPPVPATQLAMATILQSYEQKSDAGATLDAMFDMRWRMVLNCLDDENAPFSQGTLRECLQRGLAWPWQPDLHSSAPSGVHGTYRSLGISSEFVPA